MAGASEFPKLKISLQLPQYTLSELIAMLMVVTGATGVVSAVLQGALRHHAHKELAVASFTATSATLSLIGARIGIRAAEEWAIVGRRRTAMLTIIMVLANVAGSCAFALSVGSSEELGAAAIMWTALAVVAVVTFVKFETIIPQVETHVVGSTGAERSERLRAVCAEVMAEDGSEVPSRKAVVNVQAKLGERGLHATDEEVLATWRELLSGEAGAQEPGAD